jgi:hypothetical protein
LSGGQKIFGLLISGCFLADLTNFAWVVFCLAVLESTFFSLFLAFLEIFIYQLIISNFLKIILGNFYHFVLATPDIKSKSAPKKTPKNYPLGVKNSFNCIWQILADFLIRSGGLEKNHLATLTRILDKF